MHAIMRECGGRGECLDQIDFNIYAKNPNMTCNFTCLPVRCSSEHCDEWLPQVIYDIHGGCMNCAISGPPPPKGYCWHCKGKLVAIGSSRRNGADHDD